MLQQPQAVSPLYGLPPVAHLPEPALRRFCQPQHWDHAELLEQAQHVVLMPHLGDPPICEPEDLDPLDGDLLAGRRHAHELAVVRYVVGVMGNDQIAFGDQLMDRGALDRKSRAQVGKQLAEAVTAWRGHGHRGVDDEVIRHQFIEQVISHLIVDLFVYLADDRLVLFERHGYYSFSYCGAFSGSRSGSAKLLEDI